MIEDGFGCGYTEQTVLDTTRLPTRSVLLGLTTNEYNSWLRRMILSAIPMYGRMPTSRGSFLLSCSSTEMHSRWKHLGNRSRVSDRICLSALMEAVMDYRTFPPCFEMSVVDKPQILSPAIHSAISTLRLRECVPINYGPLPTTHLLLNG